MGNRRRKPATLANKSRPRRDPYIQLTGLSPNTEYKLHTNGTLVAILKTNATGEVMFERTADNAAATVFDLKPKIPSHRVLHG